MSTYGDGGFYFLQPVGRGAPYQGSNMGYGAWGEPPPPYNSALKTYPSSYYTMVKGVKVLRRPKSITSAAEASGWTSVYASRLNKAQNELRQAARLPLAAVRDANSKAAKIRIEWYKNCTRYVADLWARTQRVRLLLKPSPQVVAAAQAAAAGAPMTGAANALLQAEVEKLKAELANAQAAAAASATAADTAALATVPEVTATDVAAAPEVATEVVDDAPAEVVVVATEPVPPVVVEVVTPVVAPVAAAPVFVPAEPAMPAMTVSKDEPKAAEDESFLSKYGMYLGGAVALGVGAYFYMNRAGAGAGAEVK